MLQALNIAFAVVGAGIAGIALASVPRGRTRPPLFAFVAAGILWAGGDLVADGARDPLTKQVGIFLLYSGSITLPALWWVVALRWASDAGARLPFQSRAWEVAPLAWSGLMWLVMASNPLHGAFLTPVVGGYNVYHPLWYAMAIPAYSYILAAFVLEVIVARRVPRKEVRHQAAFLLAASAVTLVGNVLYVTGLAPVNLTVPVLSVSVSLLLVGMARDGLFGVLPSALSALAAEHPDGVVVIGPGGYVEYANARARELMAPVELDATRGVLDLLRDPALRAETDLEGDPGRWWQALQGPTGLLFQVRAEPRRWVQATARPIPGRRGRGARLLLLSDVTQRRRIERQRLRNRRLESVAALASTVSRDFQSALAVVRANAELLEDERPAGAAARYVSRILEATRAGVDLAHELQLHAGQQVSLRVTLELAEAVDETCELVEDEVPVGTELVHRRSEELLPVEADPLQLRDALFHLLANAAEASAAREGAARIEVVTGVQRIDPGRQSDLVAGREQPAGEYAFVRVVDEAGGMEPEVEERAFEPFFSTRAKDRGSGLGSVIGIARAHGALVGLENDPGWGCTFSLYLPVARRPEEARS